MIVGVALQPVGHIFNYLSGGIDLKRGDRVLVETDSGTTFAVVESGPCEPSVSVDLAALKPVLRIVNEADLRVEEENRYREQQAMRMCVDGIRERDLEMKLVNVSFGYDGRKAVFYFVAEKRIDFRNLVRDLANALRVRVEMQQIGARDETKATGGVGPCG